MNRFDVAAVCAGGFLSAVLLASPAVGDARVELRVEPRRASVGDPLLAELEIVVPTGTRVERPAPGSELGPFAVSELSWEGPEETDGADRWVWRVRLAAFETGELEVPPMTVRLIGPDGESVVRSEPVSVSVVSVIPPEETDPEIADLKAPVGMPPVYGPLKKAAAVVGGLLLLSLLAWWLHRRYAGRLARVPLTDDPFRRTPPDVWVYGELQALLGRRLPESGRVKEFFGELSRILKQYLGGRYRVALMEMTTSEVLVRLKRLDLPADAVGATRELLELADLVKFAGEAPAPDTCRACVERAYALVDATRTSAPEGERGAA